MSKAFCNFSIGKLNSKIAKMNRVSCELSEIIINLLKVLCIRLIINFSSKN